MRGELDPMARFLRHSLFVGVGCLMFGGAGAQTAEESFTWSAELVAVDTAERTVTVKARVESHADLSRLPDLDRGDQAMLTWTGLFNAAGIRSIAPGSEPAYDGLNMPVEFVSSEMEDKYLSFSVPVPAADLGRIESLEAGAWVTATSPKGTTDLSEAVVSIRPYNDVS